jgi:hypothetical protein
MERAQDLLEAGSVDEARAFSALADLCYEKARMFRVSMTSKHRDKVGMCGVSLKNSRQRSKCPEQGFWCSRLP